MRNIFENLGGLYERSLGKSVFRKARGIYYTPPDIVRYIVENTIGTLIAGLSPGQIARLRFADIACGGGAFLLGAYALLLDYHRAWYQRHPARARADGCMRGADGWRLSLAQRRAILLNNIYGMDLDPRAVEVARLALGLKLLEEENPQLTRNTDQLPPLRQNVVCGNALTENELESRFPEIMRRGGCDAIVGNPPYVDSEWMTRQLKQEREYCARRYAAATGNWDLFCVFIERTLQLARPGGLVSLIVPNKLGSAPYARGARRVLQCEHSLLSVRDYSGVRVFPVGVYPLVYVAKKEKPTARLKIVFEKMEASGAGAKCVSKYALPWKDYFQDPDKPWRVFTLACGGTAPLREPSLPAMTKRRHDAALPMAAKLAAAFPRLGDCAEVLGAATVAEAYEISELIQDGGSGIKVANSGTIDRYSFLWGRRPMRYLGESYLIPVIPKKNQPRLPAKRREQAAAPKIIVAGMTLRLECALDERGQYLAGKSTTIIFSDHNLAYLIGVLNSRVVYYLYQANFGGNRLAGGYLRVGPPQLKEIPIPIPDLSNKAEKKRHDRLIELVHRMIFISAVPAGLGVKRRQNPTLKGGAESKPSLAGLHEKGICRQSESVKNELAVLDRQIDALVCELYRLTPAEIRIITGATAGASGG